jgi:hypothetical protein
MRSVTSSPRSRRARSRGQSLVELALVVPVLLLVLLLAIDLGRAFYSWVILQNAARIGANYAGLNAEGWESNPDSPTIVAEYETRIEGDVDRALCDAPGSPPPPVFTDSPADSSSGAQTPDTAYDVGDNVRVELTCVFHPLTPVVSAIVNTNVQLGASSEFRIRAGDIAGLDHAAAIPQPSVATPTPVPTPTPTVAPTGAPTGTPGPSCTANVTISRTPNSTLKSGDSATFTQASSATGCTIASYAWTFPNGAPATAPGGGPHTVVFTSASNITVTVRVDMTTSTGLVVSDTESVRIN